MGRNKRGVARLVASGVSAVVISIPGTYVGMFETMETIVPSVSPERYESPRGESDGRGGWVGGGGWMGRGGGGGGRGGKEEIARSDSWRYLKSPASCAGAARGEALLERGVSAARPEAATASASSAATTRVAAARSRAGGATTTRAPGSRCVRAGKKFFRNGPSASTTGGRITTPEEHEAQVRAGRRGARGHGRQRSRTLCRSAQTSPAPLIPLRLGISASIH